MNTILHRKLIGAVRNRLGAGRHRDATLLQANTLATAAATHLGYDTTSTVVWARAGTVGDPPGMDPTAWWEQWLVHGTGGTGHPTTLALTALLRGLGFDTSITMWRHDNTETSGCEAQHVAVVIDADDSRWLIEPSGPVNGLIRLGKPGEVTSDRGGPNIAANVAGQRRLYLASIRSAAIELYSLVADDLSAAALQDAYRDQAALEVDRPCGVVVCRNVGGGRTITLSGSTLMVRDRATVVSHTAVDPDGAARFLRRIGMSDTWVRELVEGGVLDDTGPGGC